MGPPPIWSSAVRNLVLLLVCVAAFGAVKALAIDDIEMLPTRIKLDSAKNRAQSNITVESTDIAYAVKVNSRAFKELNNVTVRYNIFYLVAELGSTADPEIKVSTGSHVFDSLLTNKTEVFNTEPIKLEKAALDGGWYFKSGASGRTKDRVVGIWLKAFDATGQQIGEYVNPSTVPKKQKWKD